MSIDHEWHAYFKVMHAIFEAIASDSECKAMNSAAICERMISLYDYRKAEIPYHYYQGTI